MNFTRKTLLIGLITALPLGVAVAAKPKDGANPRHAAMMLEMFTRMDANRDETVTQKEIHDYRKIWFGNGDTNSDGTLSPAELDAMLATFRAGHLKHQLVRMDTDGNGKVEAEEFARFRGRWMHHLDGDGDGAIKKAEIEKAGKRHGAHRQKQKSGHGHRGHN
jgi:hypothetical protein